VKKITIGDSVSGGDVAAVFFFQESMDGAEVPMSARSIDHVIKTAGQSRPSFHCISSYGWELSIILRLDWLSRFVPPIRDFPFIHSI